MLLNKYKQREKEALALQAEIHELNKLRCTGRWQPCEPFQHGWIRSYTLRPDIAARKDAQVFRDILKVSDNEQWCINQDFNTPTHWLKSHKIKQRRPMDPPGLKSITVRPSPETGEEVGWKLPQHYKKYFWYHSVNSDCGCLGRQYYRPSHYTFRTPWMFDYCIRPAFISKLPLVDGSLESKLDVLENHMRYKQYWPLIEHMRGRSHDRREDIREELRSWHQHKELRNTLEEIQ